MSSLDHITLHTTTRSRFDIALDRLCIGLSIAMMVLGLTQWAIVSGLTAGRVGAFSDMPLHWQVATMCMAVVDPIAAVGLWLRASWGRVVWIVAAVGEMALHTVFIESFGSNLLVVGFHAVSILAMGTLWILARRFAAGHD